MLMSEPARHLLLPFAELQEDEDGVYFSSHGYYEMHAGMSKDKV